MKRSCSSLEDDTLDSTKRSCPRRPEEEERKPAVEQLRDRLRRAAEEQKIPGSRAYAVAELQAQALQRLAPLYRVWPTSWYVPAPSNRGPYAAL